MNRVANYVIVGVIILAIAVASQAIFIVTQTQEALVLRFGQPVAGRGVVTTPGLHFKIPFIENVIVFDKRILNLEMPKQEVLASDNTRVDVDAYLRYRIVDPLKFYQSVGTIARGEVQLGFILNSAVRRVLGDADMTEIVSTEREALMHKIRNELDRETSKLGVIAIDVRIRRADLPKQISDKVFARMQSEWAREAALNRAKGTQDAQKIRAKADREVVVLRADAQQQADQIRGQGDAERNKIFAAAYSKDPSFFAFYRSMRAYKAAFRSTNTRFILAPKSSFFHYFERPIGGHPAKPGSAGASASAAPAKPPLSPAARLSPAVRP